MRGDVTCVGRLVLAAVLLLSAACSGTKTPRPTVIGQAFVGPIKLLLREEIHPQSKAVATVKHGDKLEIIQVRRRFVRVVAPGGQTGWTDSRQLLSTEQMDELQDLFKHAAKLPSHGEATVYDALNVHVAPTRPSTSFYQIHEGMKVDVLAHELSPRSNEAPKPSIRIAKPAPPPRRRKPKKEPKIPPVPKPAAPGPPSNWLDLSKTKLPAEPEPEPAAPVKQVPLEDWSLIRTKDGKAGWVLTRNLVMAIPDEVAQYSEGARITSYFPLGAVQDDGQTKHHWLWTTIRGGGQTYQFDSFRIFIYVTKRHRYETAYIERNVEGHYPVEVVGGAVPRFSLVLRDKDGSLRRKTYVLEGYLVRKVADEVYSPPDGGDSRPPAPGVPGSSEPDDMIADEKPSLVDRIKGLFRSQT